MFQLKIFTVFALALFLQHSQQSVRVCKTEILRSLGYHSNIRATKGSGLCPNITHNCCTKHDEMKMHKVWNNLTERRIEMRHATAQLMLTKLNMFIGFYGGIDLPGIVDLYEKHSPQKHPEKLKEHITQLSKFFLSNPPRIFLQKFKFVRKLQQKYYKKILKLRGFLNCSMCNWVNHQFIDVIDKQMFFNGKFCLRFAQVTIDPVAQKYMAIYRLILAFDEFIYLIFNKHLLDDDLERKKLQRNLALTQSCANAPNLKNCAEFCKQINFNKFTDLLDGEVGLIKRLLKNTNALQNRMQSGVEMLLTENFIVWDDVLVKQLLKKSVINSDFGVNLKIPLEEKQEDDPKDIKLKLNITKITKVIYKDHVHHPLQIESLDSEIDSTTLYKIKEHPVDLGEIEGDVKMFGINPIADGRKTALFKSVNVFLARLHNKTDNTHNINEEIDKRLMEVLSYHRMDDFANYQNDNVLRFKKIKSQAEIDAMMQSLKALKSDFKDTFQTTRVLLQDKNASVIKIFAAFVLLVLI